MTAGGMAPARGGRHEADDRWHLSDERDFLRRSLEDADREHVAGDLSDQDHAALVARDTAKLVEVEAELALLGPDPAVRRGSGGAVRRGSGGAVRRGAGGAVRRGSGAVSRGDPDASPSDPAPRPRPWWGPVGIVAACLLIVAGGVILVTHFVASRQAGQSSSGSVTLSQAQTIEQQLRQALALNNEGNAKAALELYDKVLSEDPSNPAALAYAGYLQWDIGSSAHVGSLARIGRSEIETAVKDAPTYYEAHLFDGLVLENQDHNDAAAAAQFDDFLADGPPAGELAQVAPLVAGAYRGAGKPIPPAFASTTATTSAP